MAELVILQSVNKKTVDNVSVIFIALSNYNKVFYDSPLLDKYSFRVKTNDNKSIKNIMNMKGKAAQSVENT